MNYSSLFDDFFNVVRFVLAHLRELLTNLYDNPRFNFLFGMAIMPVLLFIAFDILISLVLSVRAKKLVFFNVFSPRSWYFLNSNNMNNRLKVDMSYRIPLLRSGVLKNKRILRKKNNKTKNVPKRQTPPQGSHNLTDREYSLYRRMLFSHIREDEKQYLRERRYRNNSQSRRNVNIDIVADDID